MRRWLRLWPVFVLLTSCVTTDPNMGIAGGTGLKQGKADACRPYREALLAREHVFLLYDVSRPGSTLVEGTAKFSRHDKYPDRFAYRVVRDKTGDLYDRHAFQLVAESANTCAYAYYDEDLQKHFQLEIRRNGDDLIIGGPDQLNGFKLSPFIDEPPTH